MNQEMSCGPIRLDRVGFLCYDVGRGLGVT